MQSGFAPLPVLSTDAIESGTTNLLVVHAIDVRHTTNDEESIAYIIGNFRAVAEAPYKLVSEREEKYEVRGGGGEDESEKTV